MQLEPGTVVDDRFTIVSLVGYGGMGAVYKAQQAQLNRLVALKVLNTPVTQSDESLIRLKREALAVSSLHHRNIAAFYACGIWRRYPYLALEFVQGKTLQDLLSAREPLPLPFVLAIAKQILEALAHAHKAGVVHRDLKPGNIMLVQENGETLVKVIDFGMAKLLPEFGREILKLTQAGTTIGTVVYMSPEQCLGAQVDQRADIYALGAILHCCLTGQPPFLHEDGDNPLTGHLAIMQDHISLAPPAMADVHDQAKHYPADLQAVVYRAMAKRLESRYQSAEEMLQDLQSIAAGESLGLRTKIDLSKAMAPLASTGRAVQHFRYGVVAAIASLIVAISALKTYLGWTEITHSAASGRAVVFDPRADMMGADIHTSDCQYYLSRAKLFFDKKDMKHAKQDYQKAIFLAAQFHRQDVIIEAGLQMAEIARDEGQINQAIAGLMDMLHSLPERPYNNSYSKVLNGLGWTYTSNKDYVQAAAWFNKRLKYEREIGLEADRQKMAAAMYGLAGSYHNLHRYNEAIAPYRQCLNLFAITRNNLAYIFQAKIDLADSYMQLKQYDRAKIIFQALIREQIDNKDSSYSVDWTLIRLGECYEALHQYNEAIAAFKHALSVFALIDGSLNSEGALQAKFDLAAGYLQLKRYNAAQPIVKELESQSRQLSRTGFYDRLRTIQHEMLLHEARLQRSPQR